MCTTGRLPLITAVFAVGSTLGLVVLASHLFTVPDYTAAALSVAGKLPTSPLTAGTALTGSLPYLIALVLDSPSFQLR